MKDKSASTIFLNANSETTCCECLLVCRCHRDGHDLMMAGWFAYLFVFSFFLVEYQINDH